MMLAFKSLHCDEKLSVELLHLGIAPAVDASRHGADCSALLQLRQSCPQQQESALNLRVSGRRGKVKAKNSVIGICRAGLEREIEKFIIRQPPMGDKDDYDSENSWISDGLPSSSRRRRRGGGRWEVGEWREK